MDAVTGTQDEATADGLSERESNDPRWRAARAEGSGEKGREMLAHVAQGADLSPEEEYSALDWLLGAPKPIEHTIPVDVETEKGMRTAKFIAKRIDPKKIDQIEIRNVQQSTGRIDRITADAEIITECCDQLEDGKRTVALKSDEFRTLMVLNQVTGELEQAIAASAAQALLRRFVGQEGVLTLVAAELRRLAGYDPQRIGNSQRRLVEASLG